MPENKEIRIGDEIAFWCSNCSLNLWGNVSAVEGGEVVQVSCRTCRTQQPYKPEKSDLELRRKVLQKAFSIRDRRKQQWQEPSEQAKGPGKNDVTKRWREQTEEVDARYAGHYAAEKNYEEGDVMIHPQHGLGVVQSVLHPNAAVVLFRTVEVPLEMNAGRA